MFMNKFYKGCFSFLNLFLSKLINCLKIEKKRLRKFLKLTLCFTTLDSYFKLLFEFGISRFSTTSMKMVTQIINSIDL